MRINESYLNISEIKIYFQLWVTLFRVTVAYFQDPYTFYERTITVGLPKKTFLQRKLKIGPVPTKPQPQIFVNLSS